MATLNLLPRKEFEITLENGTVIHGKFGTWAMKRFCQKKNYTLQQASEGLTQNLDDIIEYLLSGVEQHFREQKTKDSFTFNDIDCCGWIDELGGLSSETVLNLLTHIGESEKKSENNPVEP